MKHLAALYTFGIFIKPDAHPDNDGFHRRNDPILAAVDRAEGLIARSGYADEPGPECWGEQVYPRFYTETGDGWSPSTLSLWADLESIMAFAYSGLHAEALAHGREWFRKPEWPPYAIWWVEEDHRPDWREAVARHEHLHDNGPTAHAFSLRQPFEVSGAAVQVDRRRMKDIARVNAEVQPTG